MQSIQDRVKARKEREAQEKEQGEGQGQEATQEQEVSIEGVNITGNLKARRGPEQSTKGVIGQDGADNAAAASVHSEQSQDYLQTNERVKDRLRQEGEQPTDQNIKQAWGDSQTLHNQFKDNNEVPQEFKDKWQSHERNNSWPEDDIMVKKENKSELEKIHEEAEQYARTNYDKYGITQDVPDEDLPSWKAGVEKSNAEKSPDQLEEDIRKTDETLKAKTGNGLDASLDQATQAHEAGAYDGKMEQTEKEVLSEEVSNKSIKKSGQTQKQ